MKRFAISAMALLLAACPIVCLGAIGSVFLTTPNDRPDECQPISLVGVSAEPKLVVLFTARRDAWMQLPDEPAGCAYVRRTPSGAITVLWACGPRLGDFIRYDQAAGRYRSECFRTSFDLDGRWVLDPQDSPHRMEDMRPLRFRVVGDELYIGVYRR